MMGDFQKSLCALMAVIFTTAGCGDSRGHATLVDSNRVQNLTTKVRPFQEAPISSDPAHPVMGKYSQLVFAPDGAWAVQKYITSERPYVGNLLFNGWVVRPFMPDRIALLPNGGMDFNPALGQEVLLEQAPYSPLPPHAPNVAAFLTSRQGYHLSLDIRFDVEMVNDAVRRFMQSRGLPPIPITSVPFRSSGIFPDPQGNFWTYPFVIATHTFTEPLLTGSPGPLLGIRSGLVTMNSDKTAVHEAGTFMLEAFRPIETKVLWVYPDKRILGIEPTIFPISGERLDGSDVDIIGYVLCFHRANPVTFVGVFDQIFCTATKNTDPAKDYRLPVPITRLPDLAAFTLADGSTLGDRFPLVRYPIAAPDGTPFGPDEFLSSAYPWISHDGTALFFRSSKVTNYWQEGPTGEPMIESGPTRGALQYISEEHRRNGHSVIRIAEGLYDTRSRLSGLTAFSAGRVGPYRWHVNSKTDLYGAFPASDFEHSRLLCHANFEFDLQVFPTSDGHHVSHGLRCSEEFFPPAEILPPQDTPQAQWLAFFPGHEVFEKAAHPNGMGTAPDPSRLQEELFGHHASFVGNASFPQEHRLAQLGLNYDPDIHTVDTNDGVRGQAPRFGAGGFVQASGAQWSGTLDGISAAFFVRAQPGFSSAVTLFNFGDVLSLGCNAGSLVATLEGSSGPALAASAAPTHEDWYHIGITWSAADARLSLYVDGTRVASTVTTTATVNSNGQLAFGDITGAYGGELAIDEVAIVAWALSDKDMARLALQRQPREPTPPSDVSAISFPLGTDPSQAQAPDANLLSAGPNYEHKRSLGETLFFDTSLSADGATSCGTCHQPALGYTDGLALPQGAFGAVGTRNTPTVLNAIFKTRLFWDGRAASLEEQVVQPFFSQKEMALENESALLSHLQQAPYPQLFAQAFGEGPSLGGASLALATFVRSLVTGNSAVDRFIAGDSTALTPSETAGFTVFKNKGRCVACHRPESGFGPPAGDGFLVNTGLVDPALDAGNGHDQFMVPTLRNLTFTAPYFHDGSAATLEDVIERYNQGATFPADNVSPDTLRPLGLTNQEKSDLAAFLRALDGEFPQ